MTPSATRRGDELRGDRDVTLGGCASRLVSTWTKSRRRRLANGRTWTRWSSVPGSSTRVTRPIGMRGGYSDVTRSVRDCGAGGDDASARASTSSLRVVKRMSEVVGAPGLDLDHAADAALGDARADGGRWSVSSVTIAEFDGRGGHDADEALAR